MSIAKPEVSVVLPTFRGLTRLPKTVESVLAQTLSSLELIVVDDGSCCRDTDRLLQRYCASDPRVRLLKRPHRGITWALIEGCRLASGPFVARIDVGDVMLPMRLEKQADALRCYPECAFVACHTEVCDPDWTRLWINPGAPAAERPVDLLGADPTRGIRGDIPHHGSVMFRKSAYEKAGGYRAEFYFGQDWDLWYRLAEIGRYWIVPEVLYRTRVTPDGLSMVHQRRQALIAACSLGAHVARRNGHRADESTWLRRAAEICPDPSDTQQDGHLEPGYYFIGEALRRTGSTQCRRYFREAIVRRPFQLRAYLRWAQSLMSG